MEPVNRRISGQGTLTPPAITIVTYEVWTYEKVVKYCVPLPLPVQLFTANYVMVKSMRYVLNAPYKKIPCYTAACKGERTCWMRVFNTSTTGFNGSSLAVVVVCGAKDSAILLSFTDSATH